jgi:hypothetical protein
MLLFRYYATPVLYICKLRRYLVSWCDGDSVRIISVFLVNVSMNCWCLLEPSSAFTVTVWDNLVWRNMDFEECFVALRMISVRFHWRIVFSCILMIVSIGSIMLYLLRVCPLVKV